MSLAGAIASCSVLLLLLCVPFAYGESSEAASEAFVMEETLSESGCGAFAGLIAARAAAGDAFRAQIAGDDGGDGLTIFCPNDNAVAAFGPGRFANLTADGQVALLLYHGVATLYSEAEALVKMFGTKLATLANGPGDYDILVFGDKDTGTTVLLSSSANAAIVTEMVVRNDGLVVYLIDHVLVPGERTPFTLDGALVVLALFCVPVGILGLILLLYGLVHLVRWLKRSCQDCATAHASAARVAPDG